MIKSPSHQLRTRVDYRGEAAGKALAKWLNKSSSADKATWLMGETAGQPLVEELLTNAQVVSRRLAKYKSIDTFSAARKNKKLPLQFLESQSALNEVLGSLTFTRRIEPEGLYEGNFVQWSIADESPVAHVARQIEWVLSLLEAGAVLKIRRCERCCDWFFARFSHQTFCKRSCQMKDFSQTSAFKAKRAEYMRKYRQR